jgi:membrane protease YdiL (CAAX protease family)
VFNLNHSEKIPNFGANLRKGRHTVIFTVFRSMSPGMKALFFVLLFFMMAALGSALAPIVATLVCGGEAVDLSALLTTDAALPDACTLRTVNTVNQLVAFLALAFVFRFLFGMDGVDGFRNRLPSASAWLVPLLGLAALPLIQAAYDVNASFIQDGSALAEMVKPAETLAEEMTNTMLDMPTTTSLLINLLVVAVVPAVCEEFAFRGVLQVQLARATRNVHLGVWLTAIFFSFIHLQFYGFLPRVLLGAFFGYLVVHTGSLWTAVLAHFVNNAVVVFANYVSQKSERFDLEQLEAPSGDALVVLLAFAVFTLLYWVILQQSVWPTIKERYLTDLRGEPQTGD